MRGGGGRAAAGELKLPASSTGVADISPPPPLYPVCLVPLPVARTCPTFHPEPSTLCPSSINPPPPPSPPHAYGARAGGSALDAGRLSSSSGAPIRSLVRWGTEMGGGECVPCRLPSPPLFPSRGCCAVACGTPGKCTARNPGRLCVHDLPPPPPTPRLIARLRGCAPNNPHRTCSLPHQHPSLRPTTSLPPHRQAPAALASRRTSSARLRPHPLAHGQQVSVAAG
jgi:hypothetical protein